MIVLTAIKRAEWNLFPGDTFNLTVTDSTGINEVITETITVPMIINFICSFRFADENGKVYGHHLAGFFGDSNSLPEEIKGAKELHQLTPLQQENFIKSIGTKINK